MTRDAISNEPKPTCASCGVPWADHMGIMGVCLNNKALKEDLKDLQEEISQLTKERDEAQVDQRLIDELWERRTDMTEMKSQIELLRKERDEARCEVCNLSAIYSTFYHVDDQEECAKDRGWDCFKEVTQ